jgi:hypothetical protein
MGGTFFLKLSKHWNRQRRVIQIFQVYPAVSEALLRGLEKVRCHAFLVNAELQRAREISALFCCQRALHGRSERQTL